MGTKASDQPALQEQWHDEGYIVLPHALQGEQLTRLQTAFSLAAELYGLAPGRAAEQSAAH
jgi:hypothetical protein